MNVCEKLALIQSELKAPKTKRNSFGGYSYRTTEDIMEALKPILNKYRAILIVSDEVEQVGERYYIKATAELIDIDNKEQNTIRTSAYAREEECKPKMDTSQTTGSASSYARKYALNGLFCIDDTKDSDVTNTHQSLTPVDDEIPFTGPTDDFQNLSEAIPNNRRRRRRD